MKQINLLPKEKQRELRYGQIFRNAVGFIILSALTFGVVLALQFGARMYLQNQARITESRVVLLRQHVNKADNAVVKQNIKRVNDITSDFKNIADGAPRWSRVLKAFSVLPPDEVKISSLTVDAQGKMVSIQGFSPTRELVIKLYENILADTENFYGIDYPLENVVKATDVNFHFSFYIKDELLK